MEAVIEQGTLFPVIEEKAKKRSWLREFMDVVEREGPLLPRAHVFLCLDVSRQRVDQLIKDGQLASVKVRGREYVPIEALNLFLSEERKAGRPVRVLSDRETLRRMFSKKNP